MSAFAGMTQEQLRAALVSAQTALIELQTGRSAAALSYTQGDGSKSISRRVTSIGDVRAMILELQIALGIAPRRRAIRPVYQ